MCGVYKITNIVNGKFYVGSSKNIKNRWNQHKEKLEANKHGNIHLQNSWNKYGGSNFKFEIIEECSPEIQFEREQYYLNKLNPFDNNGYNIVRQISKEYMSDHYMVKKCEKCKCDFNTFSHLSRYCDNCKEKMQQQAAEEWKEKRIGYISPKDEKACFAGMMSNIYGSQNYFWDITE